MRLAAGAPGHPGDVSRIVYGFLAPDSWDPGFAAIGRPITISVGRQSSETVVGRRSQTGKRGRGARIHYELSFASRSAVPTWEESAIPVENGTPSSFSVDRLSWPSTKGLDAAPSRLRAGNMAAGGISERRRESPLRGPRAGRDVPTPILRRGLRCCPKKTFNSPRPRQHEATPQPSVHGCASIGSEGGWLLKQ